MIILLMGLINERQPLSLRCSVLYCIQCHFYKNEKSQEDVIKSLLPSSGEVGMSYHIKSDRAVNCEE